MKVYKVTNINGNVLLVAARDLQELLDTIDLGDIIGAIKHDYHRCNVKDIHELDYKTDCPTVIFEI